MKCQKCKDNIATIHLTEIIDGQRSEMHLCQSCAQNEGVAVKSQIPLNELLNSLLAAETEELPVPEIKDSLDACPYCGMTWEKFKKKALLGCPNDYQVFAAELDGIIKRAHGGHLEHIGKVPTHAGDGVKKQIVLLNLRKHLADALKREDYETAAKIRDEMNNLGF